MIALVLAACCALSQDEPAGAFDWARELDDLEIGRAHV